MNIAGSHSSPVIFHLPLAVVPPGAGEGLQQGKPSVQWDLGWGSSIQSSPGDLLGVVELFQGGRSSRGSSGRSSGKSRGSQEKGRGISHKGHQECSRADPTWSSRPAGQGSAPIPSSAFTKPHSLRRGFQIKLFKQQSEISLLNLCLIP